MANKEYLRLLLQGIEVWNQWRRDNPAIKLNSKDANLIGANLLEADLHDANLSEVYLSNANLRRANLSNANLRATYLNKVDLIHATLGKANLREANLSQANLNGADLTNANTTDANFREASLFRVDFRKATLKYANFRRANLSEANLQEVNLRRANLSKANLSKANLIGADLSNANLTGADLSNANLTRADLGNANLTGVDLSNANLTRADLRDAKLIMADLSFAKLYYTNLSDAVLGITKFVGNNLSDTIGIDTVEHSAPSSLGIDTLQISRGKIPNVFLRGCGLRDWEMENSKLYNLNLSNEEIIDIQYRIHDLRASRAFQINPLFISYSHSNTDFVDTIEKHLIREGIRFWRDIHHAKAGRLERQIDRAIRLNDVVLLVLSEHSTNSDWVEHEARKAREKERKTRKDALCPIALDDSWKTCRWPERLREQIKEYNILDFSNWQDNTTFQKMFSRLLDGLNLFYK